jgi:hypothetical protein
VVVEQISPSLEVTMVCLSGPVKSQGFGQEHCDEVDGGEPEHGPAYTVDVVTV